MIRLLALLLLLAALPAAAHDAKHPEWTDWLMSQHNQNDGSCCDGEDVIQLSDSEWHIAGDHYEVLHNGGWLSVPAWAMTQGRDNITGGALLWLWHGRVQCFKPGTFY